MIHISQLARSTVAKATVPEASLELRTLGKLVRKMIEQIADNTEGLSQSLPNTTETPTA